MAAKPEFSLAAATPYLDASPGALRKAAQEAVKAAGGRSDVRVDGVRFFKQRRGWRVTFDSSWMPNGALEHWRSPKTLAGELGCVPATVRRALRPKEAKRATSRRAPRRKEAKRATSRRALRSMDAKGSTREVTFRGVCYACRRFAGCWKLLAIATPARVDGGHASHV